MQAGFPCSAPLPAAPARFDGYACPLSPFADGTAAR